MFLIATAKVKSDYRLLGCLTMVIFHLILIAPSTQTDYCENTIILHCSCIIAIEYDIYHLFRQNDKGEILLLNAWVPHDGGKKTVALRKKSNQYNGRTLCGGNRTNFLSQFSQTWYSTWVIPSNQSTCNVTLARENNKTF